MLSIQIDATGSLAVRWPRKDDEIIALGDAWVAYESTRPLPSQLKDLTLALVQGKLTAAKTARASAQSGEASRTIASGEYRAALTTTKTNLERSLNFLKYKHASNLLLLENWGWNVRYTTKGGLTVRMPTKDADMIALLTTYVAYESTLAPAHQITDPTLATMQGLLTSIQTHAQTRGAGRVQRSANVQNRGTAVRELLECLQGAAFTLTLTQFNGQVHPNLGNWGYLVVSRTPPKEEEKGTGEPPV